MPVNTPPSLPTSWTDASVRASNLKDAINDVADAVNKIAAVGYAGWQVWTPALTGAGSNPNWGTHGVNGCVIQGRYTKLGRLIVATFNLRAATSGVTNGSGILSVSTPVTMKTAGYSAGMTSDLVGFGKLYRGTDSPDLAQGAHLDCSLHIADGATGAKVLGVYAPGVQGGIIDRATRTAAQTAISTSATDLTGLSVTVHPKRAGARYRVTLETHVWKESGSDSNMYAQIAVGSTVLRRTACHATIYGSAFGTGLVPVRIEYIDENPAVSLGTATPRTYKAQAFCVDGTMASFGSTEAPGTLTVEELAGSSTSGLSEQTDYVTATEPWEANDGNGGAQWWGVIVGESAA